MNSKLVAIDGPAGSGKSTVSKLVAEKLEYTYIDTGAMYRALTLKVMKDKIDFDKEDDLIKLSGNIDLKLLPSEVVGGKICVILDGVDVSEDIRKMDVSGNVKYVAKIPEVRENMVNLQRKMALASEDGAVMEGRDIGTVVLYDARYKFYVDANFEERINRRLLELEAKGSTVTREEVSEDLKQRDHADKTREVGPLKQADDAIFVDTTDLSIDGVVLKIVEYIQGKE